ncbi:ACT domain-containing protein [Clostridium akagii]|uniref:ACT domain-containing protein n=1 Tax=Clostridium akagii TaxID=91623 RepID=UPI00047EE035|nr:ACT domain-containing protein [Clostridium akagii]
MKAFITVIGEDKIGIIQGVSTLLSENKINIMDINQTLLQNYFTMIMLVDLDKMEVGFKELNNKIKEEAEKLGVTIKFQRQDLFTVMHEL